VDSFADQSKCNINVDRPNSRFILYGDAAAVAAAKVLFKEKITAWHVLSDSLPFEPYLLPDLSKHSNDIAHLGTDAKLKISIDAEKCMLCFRAANSELLAEGRGKVQLFLDNFGAHHWETTVPESARLAAAIIGKKGMIINKIRSDSGATVEFVSATGHLKVVGSNTAVAAARAMLDTIIARELKAGQQQQQQQSLSSVINLPSIGALAAVTGPGRSSAAEIERISGCTLEIDRKAQKCVVKAQ
jgi:hypothetical protein